MTIDRESLIRHRLSNHPDTVSSNPRSGEETSTTAPPVTSIRHEETPVGGSPAHPYRHYGPLMTSSSNSLAAGLRDQLPGISERKVHALLYLAQGLHFAATDKPLFSELITATKTGINVAGVDADGAADSDDQVIVGVTVARYGTLPAADLESLIRGQSPWGQTQPGEPVEFEQIREWFRTQDAAVEGTASGFPRNRRGQVTAQGDTSTTPIPDDPAEIAAFAAEMRSRM